MTERGWGRDRERRLQKLGLVAGLALALVVHLYVFFGPKVSYKPVLERAKVRRVLVARPYRKPPPPPVAVAPPKKIDKKPPTPAKISAPKEGAPVKKGSKKSPATVTTAVQKKTVEAAKPAVKAAPIMAEQAVQTKGESKPSGVVKDESEWEHLLAQLEQQHGDIETEKERLKTEQQRVEDTSQHDGDGLLEDSRIRIKVVSYPPSSLDDAHPSFTYPDIAVRESQLQSGICRVYFRVWTDNYGNIVKEQIKAPPEGPERERYKMFIDSVVEDVRFWSLPRQRSEIHIDVLFEIE